MAVATDDASRADVSQTSAPHTLGLDAAVAWLGDGGLLAYPTETVWGLAADARSAEAVRRLRAFKGRDDRAPLSILVSGVEVLAGFGLRVDRIARRLAADFWPGPLTLVLPAAGGFAPGVAREDGAVGVRCSSHAAARSLARACADAGVGPVTATSCNRSGDPAAASRAEALDVCGRGADAPRLLEGADPRPGSASTVVDLTGERPVVLRWGAVGSEKLSPVFEELTAA